LTGFDIHAAMAILRAEMPRFPKPLIDGMGEEGARNPFRILIATIP
jgi:endonuclease-3